LRRGQNRFCLEVREVGGRGREWVAGGRTGPNNVCTYKQKIKKRICLICDLKISMAYIQILFYFYYTCIIFT
jgi:hypothetical protein